MEDTHTGEITEQDPSGEATDGILEALLMDEEATVALQELLIALDKLCQVSELEASERLMFLEELLEREEDERNGSLYQLLGIPRHA